MDAAIIILGVVGVLLAAFAYVTVVLSGGTKSKVAGTSAEHARIIADLGEVRQTFTNYTPWRFRFAVLMIVVGAVCAGLGQMEDLKVLLIVAALAFLFGIATILYVVFMRYDQLDLHVRGFVLREGKSNVKAIYYPEISSTGYGAIAFSSAGIAGRPIAKSLVIEMHDGGRFEIGAAFVQFGKIAVAIEGLAKDCAAKQDLVGTYLVTGRHLNNDEPMEVQVEARSPRHAKQEAFNRFGVQAENCVRR